MHNLVIDIGNTNIKLAVFTRENLIYHEVFKQLSVKELLGIIQAYGIENSIVSTVASDQIELIELLKEKTNYTEFSTGITTGVSNNYTSTATLGLDRWAKVIAAHYGFPETNCLIIDAGTCITYDLLNSNAEYYGGSISPGVRMRFKALNHYTGRLPLVSWSEDTFNIPEGIDTETAISNGVLQGVVNEVKGFIDLYNQRKDNIKVLITGGDARFLLDQLKNTIFGPQIHHEPYLVLKGLNEVIALKYVQKD